MALFGAGDLPRNMGYACPVCETPQSDAEHLANHLAFTAMLGDDDHEEWLDDHAPGWSDDGEDELAERVEEYAKEVGFPQVFEDTTHDHAGDEPQGGELFEDELERANSQGRGSMASGTGAGAAGTGSLDGDAQSILQEAREMTEEMLDESDEEESADGRTDGEEADEE
ncbi:DUF5810 domain-containing protein [Halorussus gelatinilyticus]|uniref:DUF5810 domain-containing protein n=1 Tax=Halorussus gelatinilyticus TaxID=2937524 RepID=A0A8U0INK7_9EURY|nr:DUF5810 domain-containing protein [Halorussus gelatinilyticus]UPW02215.1 DUF5810 domain-containing protein [Halorussus gelatinilyticus]